MSEYKEQKEELQEQSEEMKQEVHQSPAPVQYATMDEPKLPYAGFWMRFWAYLIDLIVIGSLDRMIIKPILNVFNVSDYDMAIFSPFTVGSALVFFLYFVLMTKYFGQTLGKMVFGLKVISLKESPLTWSTVIFREFIGRFISKTLWFTYIIIGFLPKKQGLHDIFADTSVVMEERS